MGVIINQERASKMNTDAFREALVLRKTISVLMELLDACVEQTNCPDCLVDYSTQLYHGHKRKCRVRKAIMFLNNRASKT